MTTLTSVVNTEYIKTEGPISQKHQRSVHRKGQLQMKIKFCPCL